MYSIDDRGDIDAIKFSPSCAILAIQRSSSSVEFINFANGIPTSTYSQSTKVRNLNGALARCRLITRTFVYFVRARAVAFSPSIGRIRRKSSSSHKRASSYIKCTPTRSLWKRLNLSRLPSIGQYIRWDASITELSFVLIKMSTQPSTSVLALSTGGTGSVIQALQVRVRWVTFMLDALTNFTLIRRLARCISFQRWALLEVELFNSLTKKNVFESLRFPWMAKWCQAVCCSRNEMSC